MRAAIVGAGGAGLLHALTFRAHGVAVTHVYDPDPERARNLADLSGAQPTASLDAIAESNAEYVSVCSPPRWHVEQATRCARDGRAVFVEKPVAVETGELERLERLPGCVPVVQWRAGRALRALRDAVRADVFGPSPSACVDLLLRRLPSYFAAGRGTRACWGAGALLSVGIHAVDAVCFALGQAVVDVRAVAAPPARGELERSASMAIAFGRGAHATIRVTFDAADDETRIAFAGERVTAVIAGGEVDPTAGAIAWKTASPAIRPRLAAIERSASGYDTAPLLVHFIGEAIAALRRGLAPGSVPALPSIADVRAAHDAVFRAYADSPVASAYSPCARRSARSACSCACCIR
ncbi:MAG: Gfo/Idh/MocA family oxidoreductase [Polyangiaceae bacterium]|nr:Gfo/Idh/MocA family oxidoreductase [Polyangiaceae bacterium]